MVFQDFFASEEQNLYLLLAILAAALLLVFLVRKARQPITKKAESRIRKRDYMSMDAFLESWKAGKDDFPGCYLLLIYDKKVIFNPMNYDEIYVGQSVHVRHRVFAHLKGHGNGNVYYGLKSGCKVNVLILPCKKTQLNQAEKDLIRCFNATTSLNMTRGGAAKR